MSKNCPICNEIIDEQDLICPNCNELIIEKKSDNQVYICPVCAAKNEIGLKSCAFCCSVFPKNLGDNFNQYS